MLRRDERGVLSRYDSAWPFYKKHCSVITHKIFVNIVIIFNPLGCTCKDLVGINGYGNCKKISPSIGNVTCYVEQPSACKDLQNSSSDSGEQFSAKACDKGI